MNGARGCQPAPESPDYSPAQEKIAERSRMQVAFKPGEKARQAGGRQGVPKTQGNKDGNKVGQGDTRGQKQGERKKGQGNTQRQAACQAALPPDLAKAASINF